MAEWFSMFAAAKQLLSLGEQAEGQVTLFRKDRRDRRDRVAKLFDEIADTIQEVSECFKVAHDKPVEEYNKHCFEVWYFSQNLTDKIKGTLPKEELEHLKDELMIVFETKVLLDALYSKLSGEIVDLDWYQMTEGMQTVSAAEGKFRAAAKLLRAA